MKLFLVADHPAPAGAARLEGAERKFKSEILRTATFQSMARLLTGWIYGYPQMTL